MLKFVVDFCFSLLTSLIIINAIASCVVKMKIFLITFQLSVSVTIWFCSPFLEKTTGPILFKNVLFQRYSKRLIKSAKIRSYIFLEEEFVFFGEFILRSKNWAIFYQNYRSHSQVESMSLKYFKSKYDMPINNAITRKITIRFTPTLDQIEARLEVQY